MVARTTASTRQRCSLRGLALHALHTNQGGVPRPPHSGRLAGSRWLAVADALQAVACPTARNCGKWNRRVELKSPNRTMVDSHLCPTQHQQQRPREPSASVCSSSPGFRGGPAHGTTTTHSMVKCTAAHRSSSPQLIAAHHRSSSQLVCSSRPIAAHRSSSQLITAAHHSSSAFRRATRHFRSDAVAVLHLHALPLQQLERLPRRDTWRVTARKPCTLQQQ